MPFWKSTNFTIPSPQSSFAPTKLRRSLPDLSFFRPRRASRSSRARPRLTRQRKLRHLTDLDIPSLDADPSRPSASSSDSSPTPSSSPTNRDQPSTTHSSSVRSLPLPLPDLPAPLKREESAATTNSSSNLMNSGCCPLPSPRDVSRSRGDSKDLTAGDGNGERVLWTSTVGRPSLDQGKKELGDSIQHIQNDFGLKVPPARSSQTSGFSSPALSPQRMSTGDIYASPVYYQGLQVWSAPEFPADMTFGQTSPDKFFSVPNSKNLNGTASPLHSKMPLENAASRPETNGTVAFHPLPLPPGAALPSSPAFVHQIVQKSEVSSMKSKWQKGKLIGSGTFGNVYVATNRETGALCAMKEVNLIPDDPKSDESMMQLAQEIKVLSKLKHQNIVQYYGSEIVEDRFYIYLEYVHPGSISKYIRDHCGSMTESVVRNFTRHILSGLAYLHSKKTIHRDIKGANLLVDSSGVVKLADFGMAKHLSGRAAALSLRGSPYWMAPEVMQAMMQKDAGYDLAVDIWSLGCTIIEMFTGKPPWSEFEGAAAMFKVLRNESPPVPETLSAEGKNFLQCCFKRNPAERPSAIVLLEHPFVKNSHHPELNGTIRAISGMKLTDTTQSPRERGSSMQISTQDSNSKQSSNSETGQSYPETSKSTAVLHHSPRSTLEAIPSLSPPHSNESTQDSSPSDIPNGINPGARNSRLHPLSRHHRGREVPYLSRD